jgi:hypothetical protein
MGLAAGDLSSDTIHCSINWANEDQQGVLTSVCTMITRTTDLEDLKTFTQVTLQKMHGNTSDTRVDYEYKRNTLVVAKAL